MMNLNYTKAQIFNRLATPDTNGKCPQADKVIFYLVGDCQSLHAELTRLHTAIDGAMEEIEPHTHSMGVEGYDSAKAYRYCLDILNKHLKEVSNE
jgi:hypothetical protein